MTRVTKLTQFLNPLDSCSQPYLHGIGDQLVPAQVELGEGREIGESVPGYMSDLVVGQVEPLEGGVTPEGAEGNVPDLVVAQVEQRQFRQAVHDEADVRDVVQLVVVEVQLLHLK